MNALEKGCWEGSATQGQRHRFYSYWLHFRNWVRHRVTQPMKGTDTVIAVGQGLNQRLNQSVQFMGWTHLETYLGSS